MRATRNREYGVTRIGGSNPSSSAIKQKSHHYGEIFLKDIYSLFFSSGEEDVVSAGASLGAPPFRLFRN